MANWRLKIGDSSENITFDSLTKSAVENLGKAKLVSLNIQKEVYAPGHIEAMLQIESSDSEKLDFASILDKTVTINDGTIDVAKDYVIFECLPEYKPSGSSTSLYLTLSIYSPEHCLTLKKSNKCYVSKRFGSDIFKNIASTNSDKIKKCNCGQDYEKHFWYQHDSVTQEFIIPYLVQYEETELDFLNRIANIHGEFLYYENGVWQLGYNGSAAHKDGQKAITGNNYISASFKKLTTKDEDDDTFHGMKEDYLETIKESDYDLSKEWKGRMGFTDFQGWLFNYCNWAKKANISEILTGVTWDMYKNTIKGSMKLESAETQWNDSYVKPYKEKPNQYTKEGNKGIACPFSNYSAKKKFTQKFYQDIRKGEKKSTNGTIHIDFGTNYAPLLLCDKISILGGTYTITKISTSCKHITTNEKTKKAVTYITHEIDAIPYTEADCYPPLLKKEATNKVESQRAIVTANDDPLNLGRIQIRYPWQEEGNPTSPWVPVAQPFASSNAAIKFAPQVGDEIIIGYEYGEIERPYMIGALASATHKLDSVENKVAAIENSSPNTKNNNDFVIKSPNGHYIKFMSPNKEAAFATNFLPILKTWLGYFPACCDKITDNIKSGKNFNGAISMGDAYGLVNINMSTDKRKVLISSAMGDVQIDAFTGITISAPNGNVKIEGKNVEIVAGNNLTLKSGENVDKMTKVYKKGKRLSGVANGIKNAALSDFKKHAKILDLTLLRTIMDSVVKPIGGTMLIKSKRFLRLEAGKGSTSLPKQAYDKGSKKQSRIFEEKRKEMIVNDVISSTLNLMKWYEDAYNNAHRKYRKLAKNFAEQSNMLSNCIQAFKAKGGEVKFDGNALTVVADAVDKPEDIINAAQADNADVKKTHPKLDKITFEKENVGIQQYIRLKASHDQLIVTAEKLATVAMEYKSSINKMKDDAGEKIKTEIVVISDKEICTFEEAAYKASIYGYLRRYHMIESINKVQETLSQDVFTRKNDNEYEFDNVLKRRLSYSLLNKFKKEGLVTIKNESSENILLLDHKPNLTDLNDINVCADPEKWKDYLDCVKPCEKENSKWDNFSNFVCEYFIGNDLRHWSENFLYDPEIEGEILLSDTSGNTCKINGETVSSVPTSSIKAAIGKLKNI